VQLGSGCTSGHGVCGLARRSMRSFVAVLTFLPVAMLTAGFAHSHTAVFNFLHTSSVSSPSHVVLPNMTEIVVAIAGVMVVAGLWQTVLEPPAHSPLADGARINLMK
jgi:uncharacterized membrane protein YedE/YeeE